MSGWTVPIGFPTNVGIKFTVKDKRRKDILNLMAGPLDALVKAGILTDDCWSIVRSHDGCGVSVGPDERADITISPWFEPRNFFLNEQHTTRV